MKCQGCGRKRKSEQWPMLQYCSDACFTKYHRANAVSEFVAEFKTWPRADRIELLRKLAEVH